MSSRIGLISDIHASPDSLQEALVVFKQNEADIILCAGDIAGYGSELQATINVLAESSCLSILGNHDLNYMEDHAQQAADPAMVYFHSLPTIRQFTIENLSVYLVHANPPDSCHGGIRLLNQYGEVSPELCRAWQEQLVEFEHDVLIVGHTHQVFAERLGDTFVVNPGSSQFNHSCGILTLPECKVEWFALGAQNLKRVWNWRDSLFSENSHDLI